MARYHLSQDGNPRACRAKIKCPLGGDENHFKDEASARVAFETRMETLRLNGTSESQLAELEASVAKRLATEISEEYAQATLKLIHDFNKTMPVIWARTRAVAMGDEKVIKIPINDEGVFDSQNEVRASESYLRGEKYAIPMALTTSHENAEGVFYIEADKVEIAKESRKELPEWVDWVDCGQVGYDKNGVLVAYDL